MPGITLNPSPTGDDWAQITAAVTTLRANKLGWIEFEQLHSDTPFNIKKSVDLTSLWAADVRFAPGTIVRCDIDNWFRKLYRITGNLTRLPCMPHMMHSSTG